MYQLEIGQNGVIVQLPVEMLPKAEIECGSKRTKLKPKLNHVKMYLVKTMEMIIVLTYLLCPA